MDAAKAIGVAVAVATSIAVLSGCAASTSAPPSGVTEAELARYQEYVATQVWEFTRLPAELRPDVTAEYVPIDEWSESLQLCDNLAQFEMDAGATRQDAIITEYSCRMRPQLRAGDLALLNEAQLDYLYDYYQDHLIPCMRLHGAEVFVIYSREEAVDIGRFGDYPWNPYGDFVQLAVEDPEERAIWDACPPFPSDSVFDRYWSR